MQALLRTVMYVVAVAGGIDTYLLASDYFSTTVGLAGRSAAVAAVVTAAVVAGFLATVPITIYQSAMRALHRRRRERLAAALMLAGAATTGHGATHATGTDATRTGTSGSFETSPVRGRSSAVRTTTGTAFEPTGRGMAGPVEFESRPEPAPPTSPEPELPTSPEPAPPTSPEAARSPEPPGPTPEPAPRTTAEPATIAPVDDAGDGARPDAGVVDECEARLAESVRVFGPADPHTFAARLDLAGAYWALGQLDRATTAYEEIAAECAQVLGETDPQTLTCRSQLASAYEMDGRLDDAIALYQRTLDERELILGAGHPDTETSRRDLSIAHAVRANLNRGRSDA